MKAWLKLKSFLVTHNGRTTASFIDLLIIIGIFLWMGWNIHRDVPTFTNFCWTGGSFLALIVSTTYLVILFRLEVGEFMPHGPFGALAEGLTLQSKNE